jgi:fatty acid desaturase
MYTNADMIEEQFIERHLLDPETYRYFSKHNVWHWLAADIGEWSVIGLTMLACNTWPYWWLWIVGIFIIGTRQHALGIMAHEGVHFLIIGKKFWNDLLGNYLAAYALTYSVQGYRTNHLQHHRWLETPRDPERATLDFFPEEWTYPMPRGRFYWLLIRDMLGLNQKPASRLIRYVWEIPDGRLPHIIQIVIYHTVIITAAATTGYIWTYLLLWLLPLFTITLLCFRIRTASEHSAIGRAEDRYTRENVDTMATTRTTIGGLITGWLFAPHNMSYHVEHHLYPSVPVFRLKALHKTLLKIPGFAARVHVAKGYRHLFQQLTT